MTAKTVRNLHDAAMTEKFRVLVCLWKSHHTALFVGRQNIRTISYYGYGVQLHLCFKQRDNEMVQLFRGAPHIPQEAIAFFLHDLREGNFEQSRTHPTCMTPWTGRRANSRRLDQRSKFLQETLLDSRAKPQHIGMHTELTPEFHVKELTQSKLGAVG